MKIRIDDGMQCAVGTGIGKYTEHLAAALREASDGEGQIELTSFCPEGKRISKRLAYLWHINSRKYRRTSEEFDMVHFTNYAMPHFCSKKVKYAATVHDLAIVLQPKTLPFLYRIYAKWVLRHTLRRADLIFTVSESVKREIEHFFPKYAHKVRAIYPGVYGEMGCSAPTESFDDPRLCEIDGSPMLLMVGTVEKRKNPQEVISAYFSLRSAGKLQDCKLVLAGRDGYGAEEYHRMVEASPYAKDVIFTGYVSNNDINRLYEKSNACIFSTLYEGFGSTQLECMAHGVPLILSDIPTNREVSEGYGRFFPLGDKAALCELMLQAVESPDTPQDRQKRIEQTKAFLAKLDWQTLAPAYLDAYRELLEK